MRLRWAKSISTFFRRFCAVTLNSDAVHWRAKSLTISYFSRWTARASELGQHFCFNVHPVQSDFSARCATNVTRQNRSKILRLLRDYEAHIEIAYIEVGPEQLYRHNRDRPDAVPAAVIDHLAKKLEPPEAWEAHRLIGNV